MVGTTGERDLLADVYLPPADSAVGIGVLLIHGGAWRLGDREQLRGYGFLVGRQGIAVVSPDYRLADEAAWPAQLQDVKAGLRWMRHNAAELGIDPARLVPICHYDGTPITGRFIAGAIGDRLEEFKVVSLERAAS